MKKYIFKYYFLTTILIPLLGIILALTGDRSKTLKAFCNRYCHNRGCPHDTFLPDIIASSNGGYFGSVVKWLKIVGNDIELILGINSGGYLIANLLIFCLLIPMIHIIFLVLNIKLASKE